MAQGFAHGRNRHPIGKGNIGSKGIGGQCLFDLASCYSFLYIGIGTLTEAYLYLFNFTYGLIRKKNFMVDTVSKGL